MMCVASIVITTQLFKISFRQSDLIGLESIFNSDLKTAHLNYVRWLFHEVTFDQNRYHLNVDMQLPMSLCVLTHAVYASIADSCWDFTVKNADSLSVEHSQHNFTYVAAAVHVSGLYDQGCGSNWSIHWSRPTSADDMHFE